MLVLALVLRLAWAAPVTTDPARSFAAAFGEHALCLAAAASDETAPASPAEPRSHPDHDAAKCCQSHPAGETILSGAGTTSLIAFATPADRFAEAETPPASRSLTRPQARAPPDPAG
jgi:hypothetical protein